MTEQTITVEPYIRTGRRGTQTPRKNLRLPPLTVPRELVSWEAAGSLAAIVLLARLQLMGELAPFGLAIWAAAARDETRRLLAYGAMLLLTAAATGGYYACLGQAAGMVVFYVLRYYLRRVQLPFAVVVGLAFSVTSLLVRLPGLQPYDLLLAGLETLLAALGASVFAAVYSSPPRRLPAASDPEGIVAWTVFLGLLLLALMQEEVFFIRAAIGTASLLVLCAAGWYGAGPAAAAGALLGFFLGIQGTGFFWAAVLTFAGFFAGLFRQYGRFAVAPAFLLGMAALLVYDAGWAAVQAELAASAVAGAVFILLPLFAGHTGPLAVLGSRQGRNDEEVLRAQTAARIHDYGLVFRELASAFRKTAAPGKETGGSFSPVDRLAELVCSKCTARQRCWGKELQRTYNALQRIFADLEKGQRLQESHFSGPALRLCRKKEEVALAIVLLCELQSSFQTWHRRLAENKKVVAAQLLGLSQVMVNLAKEVRAGPADTLEKLQRRCFHVELGIAQLAKGGQEVCGDYYSYLELRDGRQVLILSDGMGAGSKAEQESSATVRLVEQLLLAGFQKDVVIRTVNTILQLRSREETFATLDMLLVDTEKGEAEFLKTGAAPSYIRTADSVQEIQSASVPLGILNEVEMQESRVSLADDTMIVMVSDGIFDVAPGKPDWLQQYLASQKHTHPQVVADEILAQACRLYGSNKLRDDLTVLVCRAKRLKHKVRDCLSA
ncbi:MAG: SpoIIE family protein phosphatase [Firmicutes bacterium]|nr:SpoIIE family protein phosphatase [Bacillota bacterium]